MMVIGGCVPLVCLWVLCSSTICHMSYQGISRTHSNKTVPALRVSGRAETGSAGAGGAPSENLGLWSTPTPPPNSFTAAVSPS